MTNNKHSKSIKKLLAFVLTFALVATMMPLNVLYAANTTVSDDTVYAGYMNIIDLDGTPNSSIQIKTMNDTATFLSGDFRIVPNEFVSGIITHGSGRNLVGEVATVTFNGDGKAVVILNIAQSASGKDFKMGLIGADSDASITIADASFLGGVTQSGKALSGVGGDMTCIVDRTGSVDFTDDWEDIEGTTLGIPGAATVYVREDNAYNTFEFSEGTVTDVDGFEEDLVLSGLFIKEVEEFDQDDYQTLTITEDDTTMIVPVDGWTLVEEALLDSDDETAYKADIPYTGISVLVVVAEGGTDPDPGDDDFTISLVDEDGGAIGDNVIYYYRENTNTSSLKPNDIYRVAKAALGNTLLDDIDYTVTIDEEEYTRNDIQDSTTYIETVTYDHSDEEITVSITGNGVDVVGTLDMAGRVKENYIEAITVEIKTGVSLMGKKVSEIKSGYNSLFDIGLYFAEGSNVPLYAYPEVGTGALVLIDGIKVYTTDPATGGTALLDTDTISPGAIYVTFEAKFNLAGHEYVPYTWQSEVKQEAPEISGINLAYDSNGTTARAQVNVKNEASFSKLTVYFKHFAEGAYPSDATIEAWTESTFTTANGWTEGKNALNPLIVDNINQNGAYCFAVVGTLKAGGTKTIGTHRHDMTGLLDKHPRISLSDVVIADGKINGVTEWAGSGLVNYTVDCYEGDEQGLEVLPSPLSADPMPESIVKVQNLWYAVISNSDYTDDNVADKSNSEIKTYLSTADSIVKIIEEGKDNTSLDDVKASYSGNVKVVDNDVKVVVFAENTLGYISTVVYGRAFTMIDGVPSNLTITMDTVPDFIKEDATNWENVPVKFAITVGGSINTDMETSPQLQWATTPASSSDEPTDSNIKGKLTITRTGKVSFNYAVEGENDIWVRYVSGLGTEGEWNQLTSSEVYTTSDSSNEVTTSTAKYDATSPTDFTAEMAEQTETDKITVAVSAKDLASGVAEFRYVLDDGTAIPRIDWEDSGVETEEVTDPTAGNTEEAEIEIELDDDETTYHFIAVDAAGNYSEVITIDFPAKGAVKIDTFTLKDKNGAAVSPAPPTTSSSADDYPNIRNENYTISYYVARNAAIAGVDAAETILSSTITITKAGETTPLKLSGYEGATGFSVNEDGEIEVDLTAIGHRNYDTRANLTINFAKLTYDKNGTSTALEVGEYFITVNAEDSLSTEATPQTYYINFDPNGLDVKNITLTPDRKGEAPTTFGLKPIDPNAPMRRGDDIGVSITLTKPAVLTKTTNELEGFKIGGVEVTGLKEGTGVYEYGGTLSIPTDSTKDLTVVVAPDGDETNGKWTGYDQVEWVEAEGDTPGYWKDELTGAEVYPGYAYLMYEYTFTDNSGYTTSGKGTTGLSISYDVPTFVNGSLNVGDLEEAYSATGNISGFTNTYLEKAEDADDDVKVVITFDTDGLIASNEYASTENDAENILTTVKFTVTDIGEDDAKIEYEYEVDLNDATVTTPPLLVSKENEDGTYTNTLTIPLQDILDNLKDSSDEAIALDHEFTIHYEIQLVSVSGVEGDLIKSDTPGVRKIVFYYVAPLFEVTMDSEDGEVVDMDEYEWDDSSSGEIGEAPEAYFAEGLTREIYITVDETINDINGETTPAVIWQFAADKTAANTLINGLTGWAPANSENWNEEEESFSVTIGETNSGNESYLVIGVISCTGDYEFKAIKILESECKIEFTPTTAPVNGIIKAESAVYEIEITTDPEVDGVVMEDITIVVYPTKTPLAPTLLTIEAIPDGTTNSYNIMNGEDVWGTLTYDSTGEKYVLTIDNEKASNHVFRITVTTSIGNSDVLTFEFQKTTQTP